MTHVAPTYCRSRSCLNDLIDVACYPVDGGDADLLVARADDLLYLANSAGKNCVRCHKDEKL